MPGGFIEHLSGKHLAKGTFEDGRVGVKPAPTRPSQRSSLETIFTESDIELSVFHFSCFISVCQFVTLSKAKYKFAENSHLAGFV